MKEFAERVPLIDARFFVTAVLTQRETGGNLSEVLDNLASVIRERFKVKRQVRVMTAHGRITGWVLGVACRSLWRWFSSSSRPGTSGCSIARSAGRADGDRRGGAASGRRLIIRRIVVVES